MVDPQFAAIIMSAEEQAEDEVDRVVAFIRPIMPQVILEETRQNATASRIASIVERIHIYSTWNGQKNQINRLLKEEGARANNVEFLVTLRGELDGRARDYVNTKILEMERIARLNKHKAMERKIDRAVRLRQEG